MKNGDVADLTALWQRVLEDVQLTMTRATFETWVQNTELVEVNGTTHIVAVPTPYALEWLENRLAPQIKEVLERHAGGTVTLQFEVAADLSAREDGASPPGQPQEMSDAAIELVTFDPTQRGWVQTSSYAIRFWQPLLGPEPFMLWLTLRSFARNGEAWPSMNTLAAITANENKQLIIGRSDRKKPGRLEVLEEERIVWPRKEGRKYFFRVLDNLPLLTPAQVAQLPVRLQRMHRDFLDKCQIDYEEWEQLTLPTLTDKEW